MTEKEFYENGPKWIQTDISEWTHLTLLAYFCHRYEKKHDVKFRLVRSKKGVELSKESSDFAKLFRLLAPENYQDLSREEKSVIRTEVNLKIKNFINWTFDYKFRSGEKSVNGTGIFLAPNIINEFERMHSKYIAKQKTTSKFDTLINWCKKEVPEIFERHAIEVESDLRMIKRYAEQYEMDETTPEMKTIAKAIEVGLL